MFIRVKYQNKPTMLGVVVSGRASTADSNALRALRGRGLFPPLSSFKARRHSRRLGFGLRFTLMEFQKYKKVVPVSY